LGDRVKVLDLKRESEKVERKGWSDTAGGSLKAA